MKPNIVPFIRTQKQKQLFTTQTFSNTRINLWYNYDKNTEISDRMLGLNH